MYTESAGPVRRRCPPGHLHAHPLSLGPPGAYHAHTGLSNDALSGSGATVGRSPRRSDNPLSSPSPHPCLLCCQCPVDVMGIRVSIVSRVSGFRGPRVKGFLGLNGFKGTKGPRASGFQGIEGFPMLTGAFKGLASPKSKRFRVQGMKDFRAPRSKG